MDIDWIVAMGLFLVVVAWSFTFYVGLFKERSQPLSDIAAQINDKIVNYLETETYIMFANYTASAGNEAHNFSVDVDFPNGANYSTRIYRNGVLITSINCMVSTNQTLFKTAVLAKNNTVFLIKFQNVSGSSPYCTGILTSTKKLKASVKEMRMMVSQTRINSLDAMSVDDIKGNFSINRPFRIEIDINNTVAYIMGLLPPNSTNIYVKEVWSKILDDDNSIKIRTMVW